MDKIKENTLSHRFHNNVIKFLIENEIFFMAFNQCQDSDLIKAFYRSSPMHIPEIIFFFKNVEFPQKENQANNSLIRKN